MSNPHTYTAEQYQRAIDAWEFIAKFSGETIDDEVLRIHILNDGHLVNQVDLDLISYSDYHGSDIDAANVKALVHMTNGQVWDSGIGRHGLSSACMTLGELPEADDTEDGVKQLEYVVELLKRLEEYPLLDEGIHGEYIEQLVNEAWDGWLEQDLLNELDEVLCGGEDYLCDFNFSKREIYAIYQFVADPEWVCETATSVVNTRHQETLAAVANYMVDAWMKPIVDKNQGRMF